MIRQEIQDSGGNGDQILPTLEGGILRFLGETVELAQSSSEVVSEKDWADALERVLFAIWGFGFRRSEVISEVYRETSSRATKRG